MEKLYIIILRMQMIKMCLKKNLVLLMECVSHYQIVTKIISAVPLYVTNKKRKAKNEEKYRFKLFLWEFQQFNPEAAEFQSKLQLFKGSYYRNETVFAEK